MPDAAHVWPIFAAIEPTAQLGCRAGRLIRRGQSRALGLGMQHRPTRRQLEVPYIRRRNARRAHGGAASVSYLLGTRPARQVLALRVRSRGKRERLDRRVGPPAGLQRVVVSPQHDRARSFTRCPRGMFAVQASRVVSLYVRGQPAVQQHRLQAAGQIDRADEDCLHLARREHKPGDLNRPEHGRLLSRDCKGRTGKIPQRGDAASHDVADKADVLIDLRGVVDRRLHTLLQAGQVFRRQLHPGTIERGRELPLQVNTSAHTMQREIAAHGNQYGHVGTGAQPRVAQCPIGDLEHQQLLRDRLVGRVGRNFRPQEIELELLDVAAPRRFASRQAPLVEHRCAGANTIPATRGRRSEGRFGGGYAALEVVKAVVLAGTHIHADDRQSRQWLVASLSCFGERPGRPTFHDQVGIRSAEAEATYRGAPGPALGRPDSSLAHKRVPAEAAVLR